MDGQSQRARADGRGTRERQLLIASNGDYGQLGFGDEGKRDSVKLLLLLLLLPIAAAQIGGVGPGWESVAACGTSGGARCGVQCGMECGGQCGLRVCDLVRAACCREAPACSLPQMACAEGCTASRSGWTGGSGSGDATSSGLLGMWYTVGGRVWLVQHSSPEPESTPRGGPRGRFCPHK